MTGGKRLRIAALFVIVLVFAFIMDMSSNAITDRLQIISGYAAFYKEHEKYSVSLDGCAGGYSAYDRCA